MHHTWRWRLLAADGSAARVRAIGEDPLPRDFASQSDAETWIGEHWRELASLGIAGAVLLDGDRIEYGPMILAEPDNQARAD